MEGARASLSVRMNAMEPMEDVEERRKKEEKKTSRGWRRFASTNHQTKSS